MNNVKENLETTTIATATPVVVNINTFYDKINADCAGVSFVSDLPNTLKATITNYKGSIDSVPHLENELLVSMKNYPQDIDHWIDSDGNMITYGIDCDSYYIDDDGYLIYDSCVGIPPPSILQIGDLVDNLQNELLTDEEDNILYNF